ncbi:MAG: hypothetical protein ABR915_09965 [Thermoguttaceae bacterium]
MSRIALVMALADQAAGRQDYRSRVECLVGSIYAVQSPTAGIIPYASGASLDSGAYLMNYRLAETGANLLRIAKMLGSSRSTGKAK